ncbi:MAG TPA: AMP-binding protein [Terriglobales bacterium]|nr:AMP-binding protein [Terriglobales bacterium]
MNFLDNIFEQLNKAQTPLLQELSGGESVSPSGAELAALIKTARTFLRAQGLKKGDRCALLAPNSIRWVAMDLAILAEGLIAVPLYARQAPGELVTMMEDCSPSFLCCGDAGLRESIAQHWPGAPRMALFDDIFATNAPGDLASPVALAPNDLISIVYTSGTSGEPKGAVLGAGGVDFILSSTSQRLDVLMAGHQGQERVFHYPPFCFAASWIMLLTCLHRGNVLMMAMDLAKLAADMRAAAPHYFLNVPVLLERMRAGIDEQLRKTGGLANLIYTRAREAWFARDRGERAALGALWLALANGMIFPTIRKKMIGSNLKALICGSAPLARETQLFFMMLGIPVLQVYGLTETTAICTMDDPRDVEPGRVGPAIAGLEMKLGENDEILVRGPNLFRGYWNRPQATADAMRDGWFHTGDQGEVNERGKWRISGRIKNLIVLSSGHNVAPEPVEDELLRLLPDAQQVVLVGHGRPFVAAIVTGSPTAEQVQFAMEEVNRDLPHYKRVRAFHIRPEPFKVEDGMMTINGKLKRDVIAARLREQIEALYARQEVRAG